MATTFIKTGNCARTSVPGAGAASEILNEALCGAKNVIGTLRWLNDGDRYEAPVEVKRHQLVYLMEGNGVITLNGKDYPVRKGAGVYLGASETAAVRPDGQGALKLFHLVVPEVKD